MQPGLTFVKQIAKQAATSHAECLFRLSSKRGPRETRRGGDEPWNSAQAPTAWRWIIGDLLRRPLLRDARRQRAMPEPTAQPVDFKDVLRIDCYSGNCALAQKGAVSLVFSFSQVRRPLYDRAVGWALPIADGALQCITLLQRLLWSLRVIAANVESAGCCECPRLPYLARRKFPRCF